MTAALEDVPEGIPTPKRIYSSRSGCYHSTIFTALCWFPNRTSHILQLFGVIEPKRDCLPLFKGARGAPRKESMAHMEKCWQRDGGICLGSDRDRRSSFPLFCPSPPGRFLSRKPPALVNLVVCSKTQQEKNPKTTAIIHQESSLFKVEKGKFFKG